jgi:hypothetical protein
MNVDTHLRAAKQLLDGQQSMPSVQQARQHLQRVELILGDLASQADSPATARRLLTMRSELGSHLLAAEDFEDASVRPEVIVSVLRRAVDRLSDDDVVDLDALSA